MEFYAPLLSQMSTCWKPKCLRVYGCLNVHSLPSVNAILKCNAIYFTSGDGTISKSRSILVSFCSTVDKGSRNAEVRSRRWRELGHRK